MDYSLLVGIHNVELGIRERAELNGEALPAPSTSNEQTGEKGENHKVLQEKFSVWDTGDGDVPHGGVPARNSNGDRLVLYLGKYTFVEASYKCHCEFENARNCYKLCNF